MPQAFALSTQRLSLWIHKKCLVNPNIDISEESTLKLDEELLEPGIYDQHVHVTKIIARIKSTNRHCSVINYITGSCDRPMIDMIFIVF